MIEKLKLYHRWWQTWRTLPVLSWINAASLYGKGKFESAEINYLRGLKKFPDHPARFSARLDISYCQFKLKKLNEAQENLRHVTAYAPQLREGHLRLARLQLWSGHSLDAAWTLRRALQKIPGDVEMIALLLLAVLENGGPTYLQQEAVYYSNSLDGSQKSHALLETAFARMSMTKGDLARAKESLFRINNQPDTPFESVLALAELFFQEGNITQSRYQLKRALSVCPEHPRMLSLYAQTYLASGEYYSPEYARQLATSACQNSDWGSPREMHILAEAYYHCGDKISALLIASKAKQAGSRLLGAYRDVRNLDKLIETLSSGTQA